MKPLCSRLALQRQLSLSQEALQRLVAHPFPGNVRELRNVLERATLLCDGPIIGKADIERALGFDPFPEPAARRAVIPSKSATSSDLERPVLNQSLGELEREVLIAALETHQGSRAKLAAKLGISERSLYRKMRALGMSG